MADPLSIAASVAGLIGLGIQVSHGLHDYYRAFRDQDENISHLCGNLESLSAALAALKDVIESSKLTSIERKLVSQIAQSVNGCGDIIDELQAELEKIAPTSTPNTTKESIKAAGRRLAYPFRKSTLEKLVEDVGEFRANLALALDVLHLIKAKSISDDVDDVRRVLDTVRAAHVTNSVRNWLQAPDATSNHNDACSKRHSSTGLWLVESKPFQNWLLGGSWLWISGFAGCGKSVLCSTAISHTLRREASASRKIGLCFFYFTFSDQSKQDLSSMLRTVVLQLSHQVGNSYKDLEDLQKSLASSSPSNAALMELLRNMIQNFHQVYLLIDALDESPLDAHREAVLKALQDIHDWNEERLHLLVTSRDARDIRDAMAPMTIEISMENEGVDSDIARFVREHLQADPTLNRKWRAHHDHIEKVLTERAQGVFRWVECQFRALARCPVSKSALERHLNSMPRSLDQTYERMLMNVSDDFRKEACQILTMLSFATRPLYAGEIIDYLAIDASQHKQSRFDVDKRYADENDILEIVPGFLLVTEDYHNFLPARRLRIAHFSVQEYLVSDRIRTVTSVSAFYIDAELAHVAIAEACLAYLTCGAFDTLDMAADIAAQYPLLRYAVDNWDHHAMRHNRNNPGYTRLVEEFFTESPNALQNWLELRSFEYSGARYWKRVRAPKPQASPLYVASALGLRDLVKHFIAESKLNPAKALVFMSLHEAIAFGLVSKDADRKPDERDDLLKAGPYGSALHSAVNAGRLDMAQLLLDSGMDVNTKGSFRTPFDRDSIDGPIVLQGLLNRSKASAQLALSKGAKAEPVLESVFYWVSGGLQRMPNLNNMLQFMQEMGIDPFAGSKRSLRLLLGAATTVGHVEITERLLAMDLDITVHGRYNCPLAAILEIKRRGKGQSDAAAQKLQENRDIILELLLARLAAMPGRTSCCDQALEHALYENRLEVFCVLMERYLADHGQAKAVHKFNRLTKQAVPRGHNEILAALIRGGAQASYIIRQLLWGSPYANEDADKAIEGGVRLVLSTGDDSLTPDEKLTAAAFLGLTDTVMEYIKSASEIGKQVAFTHALRRERNDLIHPLLDSCAQIPKMALVDACRSNPRQLPAILAKGVKASAFSDGLALYVAAEEGAYEAVGLLIEHGALVNQAVESAALAPYDSDPEDVDVLLAQGVYRQPSVWGSCTPISIASRMGHTDVVRLLIQGGAQVDSTDDGFTPLMHASREAHLEIVRLLLAEGANVNAVSDSNHTPLSLCMSSRRLWNREEGQRTLEILRNLCDAGADIEYVSCGSSDFPDTTVLVQAVTYNSTEAVEYLLDKGAEIHYRALEATNDNRQMLQLLHTRKRQREEQKAADQARR